MNAISEAIHSAQAGVRRLAGDGVNIQIEVEQILVAFEHRQPDAMDRAERLRDRLVAEAKTLLDAADHQNRMVAKGWDWRADKEAQALSRATTLTAAASHVSDLIEIFAKLRLRDGDLRDEKGLPAPGPTTETLYQLRHKKGGDPVLRLRAMEKLTDDHVRSAREIEAVMAWAVTGLGLKVQRLPVKIDASEDGVSRTRSPAEHQEHMALLHAMVYVPWAHGTTFDALSRRVRHKEPVCAGERYAAVGSQMVLALVGGESLKVVAGRWKMRSATALGRVQAALDRYAKMRGEFSRETSGDSTVAAVASIQARRDERERR